MKYNNLNVVVVGISVLACCSLQGNQLNPTEKKALEKQVIHGTASFDTHTQLLKNRFEELKNDHQQLQQEHKELRDKFHSFAHEDDRKRKEYKTFMQQIPRIKILQQQRDNTEKAMHDYSFFHKMEKENEKLKDPKLADAFKKLKEHANQLKILQDKEQKLLQKKTLFKKKLDNDLNENQIKQHQIKDGIESNKQIVIERTLPLITTQPDEGIDKEHSSVHDHNDDEL